MDDSPGGDEELGTRRAGGLFPPTAWSFIAADADARADVYSLGALFHEMLAGSLPLGNVAATSERCGLTAAGTRWCGEC